MPRAPRITGADLDEAAGKWAAGMRGRVKQGEVIYISPMVTVEVKGRERFVFSALPLHHAGFRSVELNRWMLREEG